MTDQSILEIIGPVMVGPSSSHTAGAVRLGRIALAIFGEPPESAQVELHGSFAQTGRGHGTDKAIVAGLLGMSTDDERIRDSLALAEREKMAVSFLPVDLGDEAHPNTARITLMKGDRALRITGVSLGGGQIEVTNIQGYAVRFRGGYDTLIILANDQLGTINGITRWLLEHKINVAFFRVERQKRGGQAIMIVETDQTLPDDLVHAISGFEWVYWVRQVPKIQG